MATLTPAPVSSSLLSQGSSAPAPSWSRRERLICAGKLGERAERYCSLVVSTTDKPLSWSDLTACLPLPALVCSTVQCKVVLPLFSQSGALSLVDIVEIVILLVESFIELKYFHGVPTLALLYHKEPARIQSPLLEALELKIPPLIGALDAMSWFFMV